MGKRLGQHFLINPEAARNIVDILSPHSNENILEIGPGRGFLTSYLVESEAMITGVEIDSDLVNFLRNEFKEKNFKIINEDFLKYDLDKIDFDKICGNVPYQISGKIIEKIVFSSVKWKMCVLMLSEAVARRVTASAGNSERSALSVVCEASCNARFEFKVGRDEFDPPPKIDSAVISLRRLSRPMAKEFYTLVRGAFGKRRKKIKNSLSICFSMPAADVDEILNSCGISPGLRAQDLEIKDFKELTRKFVNIGVL